MSKVCVSLGGGLIAGPDGFHSKYVAQLVDVVKKEKNMDFAIVCGGGHYARTLIDAAISGGVTSNIELDKLGIEVTRLNALIVRDIFDAEGVDVAPVVPTTTDQVRTLLEKHRVVVCGGFVEGITTDACAVLAADAMGSKSLINISKLGYVYDKDPNKFRDAKKLEHLSYEKLGEIANDNDERKPRTNVIFDRIAVVLAARSRIEIRFVDGEIKDFVAAVHGKPHNGTTVKA